MCRAFNNTKGLRPFKPITRQSYLLQKFAATNEMWLLGFDIYNFYCFFVPLYTYSIILIIMYRSN